MNLEERRQRFLELSNKFYTTDKEDVEFDRLADDEELSEYMYKKGDYEK